MNISKSHNSGAANNVPSYEDIIRHITLKLDTIKSTKHQSHSGCLAQMGRSFIAAS